MPFVAFAIGVAAATAIDTAIIAAIFAYLGASGPAVIALSILM
jgi:hypothetical protein